MSSNGFQFQEIENTRLQYMEVVPSFTGAYHARFMASVVVDQYWMPLLQKQCPPILGTELPALHDLNISWHVQVREDERMIRVIDAARAFASKLGWGVPVSTTRTRTGGKRGHSLIMKAPWHRFFPDRVWYQRWAAGVYALDAVTEAQFDLSHFSVLTKDHPGIPVHEDRPAVRLGDTVWLTEARELNVLDTRCRKRLKIPEQRCLWSDMSGGAFIHMKIEDLCTLLLQELRGSHVSPEVVSALGSKIPRPVV